MCVCVCVWPGYFGEVGRGDVGEMILMVYGSGCPELRDCLARVTSAGSGSQLLRQGAAHDV